MTSEVVPVHPAVARSIETHVEVALAPIAEGLAEFSRATASGLEVIGRATAAQSEVNRAALAEIGALSRRIERLETSLSRFGIPVPPG